MRARVDRGGKRRNMMTHLHMHGFPSGLLERVETSLTSLSTCLISALMIVALKMQQRLGKERETYLIRYLERISAN